jgi:hypothetical protein
MQHAAQRLGQQKGQRQRSQMPRMQLPYYSIPPRIIISRSLGNATLNLVNIPELGNIGDFWERLLAKDPWYGLCRRGDKYRDQ